MSHWLPNLPRLLDGVSGTFGVAEVRHGDLLDSVRQTGFVWAAQPGVLCLAMNRKYLEQAGANPRVAAIIVPPVLVARGQLPGAVAQKALIVCDQADQLYHYLHCAQQPAPREDRAAVDPGASVDPSAVLRGAVRIGAGSVIGPRVVISGPVDIGRDVQVDAGAIIGCEGLYAKKIAGARRHVPHFGSVEIGDGAYIHAGAVIVRSAVHGEATRIGRHAHVGILSNIGHDVQIGEAATVSSNVVVAGRAQVGAGAWLGASSTVSNMVEIGDGAEVRLGAVVVQDVPASGDVSGNFALAHAKNMKRFLRDNRHES